MTISYPLPADNADHQFGTRKQVDLVNCGVLAPGSGQTGFPTAIAPYRKGLVQSKSRCQYLSSGGGVAFRLRAQRQQGQHEGDEGAGCNGTDERQGGPVEKRAADQDHKSTGDHLKCSTK